jgi:hypothetical protein
VYLIGSQLHKNGNLLHNSSNHKQQGVTKMGKSGSGGVEIGQQAVSVRKTWVQTERAAHEAWAGLIARKPRAAMLLHHFVALMGERNAVVISQKTLAKMLGVTDRTVRSALADLVAERWISVVKLNGPGTVSAYVVNDRVAWGERRNNLPLSVFSATVVADQEDQDAALLGHGDLRRIPSLYPGERQLPSGAGQEPPSQPSLGGLEPDLPSIQAELEQRGQLHLGGIDPETGEILP